MNTIAHLLIQKTSKQGIILSMLILFSGILLLQDRMNTALYVMGELLVIYLIYTAISKNIIIWSVISESRFINNLLILSITVRFISIIVVYLLQQYAFTGREIFIHPDSWTYQMLAERFSTDLSEGFNSAFNTLDHLQFDDKGYAITLGTFYYLFDTVPFVGKLINMVIGSFSVVLIYKTAKIIYGDNTARTAAIISALYPYFLYYNAVLLKEIIMIYFVILAIYFFYRCLYEKSRISNYVILGIAIIGLMFFRLVLGAAVIVVFSSYLVLFFGSKGGLSIKLFTTAIFFLSAIFLLTLVIPEIVEKTASYYERRHTTIEGEVGDLDRNEQIQRSYKSAELAPMLLAAAIFAPYPSFAKIEGKEFNNVKFGAALIKMTLMFFFYYGLIWTFKNQRQKGYVIYAFTISYIGIIAVAGSILQHRFQLPANPFQIMIAAAGIHNMSPKFYRLWKPYLVFCFVITMAYNVFKLNIRGM